MKSATMDLPARTQSPSFEVLSSDLGNNAVLCEDSGFTLTRFFLQELRHLKGSRKVTMDCDTPIQTCFRDLAHVVASLRAQVSSLVKCVSSWYPLRIMVRHRKEWRMEVITKMESDKGNRSHVEVTLWENRLIR